VHGHLGAHVAKLEDAADHGFRLARDSLDGPTDLDQGIVDAEGRDAELFLPDVHEGAFARVAGRSVAQAARRNNPGQVIGKGAVRFVMGGSLPGAKKLAK